MTPNQELLCGVFLLGALTVLRAVYVLKTTPKTLYTDWALIFLTQQKTYHDYLYADRSTLPAFWADAHDQAERRKAWLRTIVAVAILDAVALFFGVQALVPVFGVCFILFLVCAIIAMLVGIGGGFGP